MDTIHRFGCFTSSIKHPLTKRSSIPRPWKPTTTQVQPSISLLRTNLRPVSEIAEQDVLGTFLKERQMSGDFISRISDMLWQRDAVKFVGSNASLDDTLQQSGLVESGGHDDDDGSGGFLKLTRTQEWVSGDPSAPINKKAAAKALQDDRERRKILNFLKYEAIKRELLLLSIGVGTACTGYCVVVLSIQAAVSYATGVLFSCLYLQLLYRYVDNLSREAVPLIFRKNKTKKIGIRSEDLQDFFERSIKGSGIALSSPRLAIPATIYGLWILSHQYLSSELFDFQIVPAMLGMFVYKAAALVQVYRDNEDLQFIFPED